MKIFNYTERHETSIQRWQDFCSILIFLDSNLRLEFIVVILLKSLKVKIPTKMKLSNNYALKRETWMVLLTKYFLGPKVLHP